MPSTSLKIYWTFLSALVLILLAGCSILPDNIEKTTSFAYRDTDSTRLGKITTKLKQGQGSKAGILPLTSGVDAFTARYILAKNAERSIDVQYYIWHNDTTGKLLAYALLQAANRGVRVRLLLDDINTAEKDAALLALNNHKNVEVRLFNPFANRSFRFFEVIADFFRINRRMHNKSFTVDNQATIVGGRNIGDEYFEANPTVDFHDFDVLAIGDIVNDVSVQFDKYWNHEQAIPVDIVAKSPEQDLPKSLNTELQEFFVKSSSTEYIQAVRKSEFIKKLEKNKLAFFWDEAKLLYDPPDKINPDKQEPEKYLIPQLEQNISKTKQEVILISPYLIPGDSGMEKIRSLINRNISVKILTNSLASTDVPLVYSGYAPYRIPLINSGVELYEIKTSARSQYKNYSISSSSRASLHSKVYIFDRSHLFIGSLNLDPRSSKLNTEMGILLLNTSLATLMANWWDKQINQIAYKLSVESYFDEYDDEEEIIYWEDLSTVPSKRYERPPKADFLKVLTSEMFSIFPIEEHL